MVGTAFAQTTRETAKHGSGSARPPTDEELALAAWKA